MLAVPMDRGSAQAWVAPAKHVPKEGRGAQRSVLLGKECPNLQLSLGS